MLNLQFLFMTHENISAILIITYLVFFNQASAEETEHACQEGSSFLQNKLNTARKHEISDRYAITDDLFAQADNGKYNTEATGYKPKLSGAGGYYGDKDWRPSLPYTCGLSE